MELSLSTGCVIFSGSRGVDNLFMLFVIVVLRKNIHLCFCDLKEFYEVIDFKTLVKWDNLPVRVKITQPTQWMASTFRLKSIQKF